MCKNNNKQCCLVLLLLFIALSPAVAEMHEEKTYQDYPEWDLLPKATDFEDENIENARQRLIDEGDAAYEGLLAIVTECEDKRLARIALGILRATSGDKHLVVETLRPFFIRRLPVAGAAEGWLMTDIARYLADFGTEDDMDALLPLLDHPNWRMRIAGAHYLGQSGGQRALKALEQARSRDSDKTVQQAIDQAILRIEQRLETPLVSEDSKAESEP